jgi:hypothetical protein
MPPPRGRPFRFPPGGQFGGAWRTNAAECSSCPITVNQSAIADDGAGRCCHRQRSRCRIPRHTGPPPARRSAGWSTGETVPRLRGTGPFPGRELSARVTPVTATPARVRTEVVTDPIRGVMTNRGSPQRQPGRARRRRHGSRIVFG